MRQCNKNISVKGNVTMYDTRKLQNCLMWQPGDLWCEAFKFVSDTALVDHLREYE